MNFNTKYRILTTLFLILGAAACSETEKSESSRSSVASNEPATGDAVVQDVGLAVAKVGGPMQTLCKDIESKLTACLMANRLPPFPQPRLPGKPDACSKFSLLMMELNCGEWNPKPKPAEPSPSAGPMSPWVDRYNACYNKLCKGLCDAGRLTLGVEILCATAPIQAVGVPQGGVLASCKTDYSGVVTSMAGACLDCITSCADRVGSPR